MLTKIRDWLSEKNNIPCNCGCRLCDVKVHDRDGMQVLEFSERCSNCGEIRNYWAYGYYELPTTYTELIRRKLDRAVQWIKHILKGF